MLFEQIETTGCRLVVALTWLGFLGPKHHAIVIGRNTEDGQVYVADSSREEGYRLMTRDEFESSHGRYGEVRTYPNQGDYSDVEVAQRALDELLAGGHGEYNVVTNNCESFSNRAMHNHSVSKQVANTVVGIVVVVGGALFARRFRKI